MENPESPEKLKEIKSLHEADLKEVDKKINKRENKTPQADVVSRRTFLYTVGGFATAVGFLGASVLGSSVGGATVTPEVERLNRELKEATASREALLKIFTEKKIASGGGLVELAILNFEKQHKVPVILMFSFDPNMVLLHVDGNREPFLLPTHSLGELVIDPNSFILTFTAQQPQVTFSVTDDDRPMARLKGTGGCGVSATSSETRIGGQALKEDVNFEMTVVDRGGSVVDDFSVKFLIHDKLSPTLFSIFGPEVEFSGNMISGKITIKELPRLPI